MVMHNRFAKLQDADQLREIVKWYADRYLTDPVDEAWFDRVFEAADERYAADFSNYNCLLSDEAWDAVRRHCDKLRVVYVLRDPVARLWSHMKFEFIPAGKRDALVNGDKAALESFLAGPNSAHARYGDILESLQRNLSKDEFKIIFLEDFIETFPQSIRFLEEFLELSQFDYLGINPERKANATENIYIPNSIANSIRDAVMPQLEKLQSLGVDIGRYHRLHNAEQITELERSLHRHKHLSGSS